MQPKISADYIENLRVKFLDTRPAAAKAIAQASSGDASASSVTSSLIQAADKQDALTGHSDKTMTAKDFDQLLYANVRCDIHFLYRMWGDEANDNFCVGGNTPI